MKFKKQMVSAVVVIIFTIGLIIIADSTKDKQVNNIEDTRIEDLHNVIDIMKHKIGSLASDYEDTDREYTGTIPPFTYTVDIVQIDIADKSVYGITSNKDTYSGLMRYDLGMTNTDVSSLELYSTYNIECRPLIRDTLDGEKVTPYVEVINIHKATQEDKERLDLSKYELSRYTEFKLKYEIKTLKETIEAANNEYYKWTDNEILDFQAWIKNRGYTDDFEIASNVKTLEQLKNLQ